MAKCTYEQCLPSGYTENGKNQEFKSTKTSQTHCFGKLKRLASSTVLVYQNSSFSTVLALQKGIKITVRILIWVFNHQIFFICVSNSGSWTNFLNLTTWTRMSSFAAVFGRFYLSRRIKTHEMRATCFPPFLFSVTW